MTSDWNCAKFDPVLRKHVVYRETQVTRERSAESSVSFRLGRRFGWIVDAFRSTPIVATQSKDRSKPVVAQVERSGFLVSETCRIAHHGKAIEGTGSADVSRIVVLETPFIEAPAAIGPSTGSGHPSLLMIHWRPTFCRVQTAGARGASGWEFGRECWRDPPALMLSGCIRSKNAGERLGCLPALR